MRLGNIVCATTSMAMVLVGINKYILLEFLKIGIVLMFERHHWSYHYSFSQNISFPPFWSIDLRWSTALISDVSGFVMTCCEAVLPQYPTLLTPWRGAPGPCACCSGTCVPVRPITSVAVPTPCYAYLNVSPCEAGDRRTVQELQVPTFAVPKTLPKVPQGRIELPGYLRRTSVLRTIDHIWSYSYVVQLKIYCLSFSLGYLQ